MNCTLVFRRYTCLDAQGILHFTAHPHYVSQYVKPIYILYRYSRYSDYGLTDVHVFTRLMCQHRNRPKSTIANIKMKKKYITNTCFIFHSKPFVTSTLVSSWNVNACLGIFIAFLAFWATALVDI